MLSRLPNSVIPEDQRMMLAVIHDDQPAIAYAYFDTRFVLALRMPTGRTVVTSCQN